MGRRHTNRRRSRASSRRRTRTRSMRGGAYCDYQNPTFPCEIRIWGLNGKQPMKSKIVLKSLADVENLLANYDRVNMQMVNNLRPGDLDTYDTIAQIQTANNRIKGAIAHRAESLRDQQAAATSSST